MKFFFTVLSFFLITNYAVAQNVAINTNGAAANSSAIIDASSADRGILIPRVFIDSAADKSTINLPATSLLIYNTSTSTLNGLYGAGYYYNIGTATSPNFLRIASNNETWLLNGNSNTNAATHFIGTTDAQDLTFKINSLKKMLLTQNGRLELYGSNTDSSVIAIGKNAGVNNTSNSGNIFIGKEVAQNNTGNQNTIMGTRAARSNTIGYENVFVGYQTAMDNVSGRENTFVGSNAGTNNVSGSTNTFLGNSAGFSNIDGGSNTILGSDAGISNISGDQNVFIGNSSGRNSLSSQNIYIGNQSGNTSTSGGSNTFVGVSAGGTNKYGSFNSLFGRNTDVGDSSYTNATAIGSRAFVNASNSLVLGSLAGINGASATVNVGIGTIAPTTRLEIGGALSISPRLDTIQVISDNFLITVGNNSLLRVNSNSAIPADRTITLSNGLANGQLLFIRCISNGISISPTSNITVNGTIDMDENDIIQFIWDGTKWYQTSFSNND